MRATWTGPDRQLGKWSCYAVVGLSLLYVPALVAGFIANGNFTDPIRDPYRAVMEVLILLLSVALIVAFSAVHAYAPASMKTLSRSALLLVALTAGITICVHAVLLTVGRQADVATLPGFSLLFSWTWPSAVYALDVASWDFCLGSALILAAPVFFGSRLSVRVRRGLLLSGVICLVGLLGAILSDMNVRDIGIVGYAVVLPVVMFWMGRLFAATPAVDDEASLTPGTDECPPGVPRQTVSRGSAASSSWV